MFANTISNFPFTSSVKFLNNGHLVLNAVIYNIIACSLQLVGLIYSQQLCAKFCCRNRKYTAACANIKHITIREQIFFHKLKAKRSSMQPCSKRKTCLFQLLFRPALRVVFPAWFYNKILAYMKYAKILFPFIFPRFIVNGINA